MEKTNKTKNLTLPTLEEIQSQMKEGDDLCIVSEATSFFVDALQSLLDAGDNIYSGLISTYGEEEGETKWLNSEADNLLEKLKTEVKTLLGDSVEQRLCGV